ncbi:MAG: hypothetical protein LUF89_10330, partial [Ruminococcus sp.]|nr:hypothetical protein [Ruminococcus sp.]
VSSASPLLFYDDDLHSHADYHLICVDDYNDNHDDHHNGKANDDNHDDHYHCNDNDNNDYRGYYYKRQRRLPQQ